MNNNLHDVKIGEILERMRGENAYMVELIPRDSEGKALCAVVVIRRSEELEGAIAALRAYYGIKSR